MIIKSNTIKDIYIMVGGNEIIKIYEKKWGEGTYLIRAWVRYVRIYICEIWNIHENFEKFITKSIYAQKIQDSGVIRTVMWRLMIYQKEKIWTKNKN
jgi:hypothetical protein